MSNIVSILNGAAIGGTESIINADGLKHNGLIREETAVAENGQQNSTYQFEQVCGRTAIRKFTAASFFAGVGGIDLGCKQTGRIESVYANEFNKFAATTYEANSNIRVDCRDIRTVLASEIPEVDIIKAGFDCQPFSIAGLQQGFLDGKGRGTLVFEVLRLVHEKKPRVLLCENVGNLVRHQNGTTFAVILEAFQNEGYTLHFQIMNAKDYGNIPQNRERVFIVGFRDKEDSERFAFPDPISLTTKLTDVIDFNTPVDERFYYTRGKYHYKDKDLFDLLDAAMQNPDSVYQWRHSYVRENKSHLVPCLTANGGMGGHNVPLIRTSDGRIRRLTPRECFSVQGFPADFNLPPMADNHLYAQAGNSVCVPLVHRIAENIVAAIS